MSMSMNPVSPNHSRYSLSVQVPPDDVLTSMLIPKKAADALEDKDAEIERLRATLKEIAARDPLESISASIARAALAGDDNNGGRK